MYDLLGQMGATDTEPVLDGSAFVQSPGICGSRTPGRFRKFGTLPGVDYVDLTDNYDDIGLLDCVIRVPTVNIEY